LHHLSTVILFRLIHHMRISGLHIDYANTVTLGTLGLHNILIAPCLVLLLSIHPSTSFILIALSYLFEILNITLDFITARLVHSSVPR